MKDKTIASRFTRTALGMAACLGLAAAGLLDAGQGGSTLVLDVRPDALVQAGTPREWRQDGSAAYQTELPVRIAIRLAPGSTGVLTAFVDDSSSADTPLQMETPEGPQALSPSGTAVRSYARSGVYAESIVIRGASSGIASPVRLRLRLLSSDGAAISSAMVPLPALPGC